ncbi:hypothetical protein JCM10295v2_000639 [Rhodotorula toruloides]
MSQTPDVPLFAVPDLDFLLDELDDLPAEQLFLVPFRPDATEEHRQRAYEIFWARKEATERAGSGGGQENGVGLQVGKTSSPWRGSRWRLSSIEDTEEGLPTPGGSQDGGAADSGGVVPASDQVETNHFNKHSNAPSSSSAPMANGITDPSSSSATTPFGISASRGPPSKNHVSGENGFYADASSSGDAPSSSTTQLKKYKGKGKAVALPDQAAEVFSGTITSKTMPSFSPSSSAQPRATRSTNAKESRWQRGPDRSIEVVVEIPLHPAMTNLSPALRKKLFGEKKVEANKGAGAKKGKIASTVSSGTKRKTRSSMAAAEQAEDEASERAVKKRKTSAAAEGKNQARVSTSSTFRCGRSSSTSTASIGKRKTRRSSSAGFEVLIKTPKRSTKGMGKGAAGTPAVRFTDHGDILVASYHPTPQLSCTSTVISAADQKVIDTSNDIAVEPVASGSGLAPNGRSSTLVGDSSTLVECSSTASADDDTELLAEILALPSDNAAQTGPSTSPSSGLAKAAMQAHDDNLFSGTDNPIELDEAAMTKILAAIQSNEMEQSTKGDGAGGVEEEVDEVDDDFGLARLKNEFGSGIGIGVGGTGTGENAVEHPGDKAKADAPAPPPFATGPLTAPNGTPSASVGAKPTSSRSQPAHSQTFQRATSATDDEDALISPSLRVGGDGKKKRRKARMSGELEWVAARCASV